MSLVEQIQNLQCSLVFDENFNELREALEKYHEMVENGILIPRGNCVMNNYTTFISDSNLQYSND